MIRAVFRKGKIQPIDAVPLEWSDGQELVVDALAPEEEPESFDDWVAELNAAAAAISDEDHERMMAALVEVEAESKRLGAREMERSASLFRDELDSGNTQPAS